MKRKYNKYRNMNLYEFILKIIWIFVALFVLYFTFLFISQWWFEKMWNSMMKTFNVKQTEPTETTLIKSWRKYVQFDELKIVDEYTFKDEKTNTEYFRKASWNITWYTCSSNLDDEYQKYFKVIWDNKCIYVWKHNFIRKQDTLDELKRSWLVVWSFLVDHLDLEKENFQNNLFVVEWKKIFLWDISEWSYYSFDNWDNVIAQYYLLVFDQLQWKKKVVAIKEKWKQKMVVLLVKDSYKEDIQYITKRVKELYEKAMWISLVEKFDSKKEETLAKIYELMINNISYCYECLWRDRIYEWMNWIQTLKSKTWVCDWIAKWVIYLMNEWWYQIQKETWKWCHDTEWKVCENHAWLTMKLENWKTKYYDPTWDIQNIKDSYRSKLFFNEWKYDILFKNKDSKENNWVQLYTNSFFSKNYDEFIKQHKKWEFLKDK